MIPFVRQMAFEYGRVDRVSPRIRRVIARNPGPFTFHGTGTYIVGSGEVAVIDPGPMLAEHLQALKSAVAGETVTAILITHDHADHAPLASALAKHTGAPILGGEPHPDRRVAHGCGRKGSTATTGPTGSWPTASASPGRTGPCAPWPRPATRRTMCVSPWRKRGPCSPGTTSWAGRPR